MPAASAVVPDVRRKAYARRWSAALSTSLILAVTALVGPPAAIAAGSTTPAPAAPALVQAAAAVSGSTPVDPISHDPTIVKQGRYFYDIYTRSVGAQTYLPVRRSTDLVHWTALAPIFTGPPAWMTAELGFPPADLWAPDVAFFAGEYHLYYAGSLFGTNESVIGLATATTLDPDSPAFGWVDRGMVLRSGPGDDFNAIDPDVILDQGHVPWLAFGSFWDGIKMRRLDGRTGLLSTADGTLYSLASRGGGAIEAASLLYRGGYYYLFVSFDYCCRRLNSDYRVMMGRSRSVTGPYLDRAGVDLYRGGGTEVLTGYGRFRGPGHGEAFSVGGAAFFAHHYYDATDAGLPKLSVRPISWTGGWPTLGDPLSGNRGVGHGNAYLAIVAKAGDAVLANPSCGYEGADITVEPFGPATDATTTDPCRQWRPEERGDGWSSLLNRHSNKVAEVAACVNAEGARVAQWGWLDNDCQRFRFDTAGQGYVRIENRLAGRVLAAAGCAGPGSPVQAVTWTGADCQRFRLDPVGDVLLADRTDTGILAGVACGSAEGLRWEDTQRAGNCQLWRFRHVGDGYYAILHRQSGRGLAVVTRNGVPGVGLVRAADADRWRIEPGNDGTYLLVNAAGVALQFDRDGVRPAVPGASAGQQLRILTP